LILGGVACLLGSNSSCLPLLLLLSQGDNTKQAEGAAQKKAGEAQKEMNKPT